MVKNIFVLVIMVLFFGCATKTPPVQKYTIETAPNIKAVKNSTCKTKTLKILEPYSSDEYLLNELHYVVGENEQNRYNYSAWSVPLVNKIYILLLGSLRKARIYKTVLPFSSVASSDEVLEVEIDNAKQYYNKELTSSYVVVDITLSLIDKKTYTIKSQKRFYKKVATMSLDAKGGVEALSKAFDELLVEMIKWSKEQC